MENVIGYDVASERDRYEAGIQVDEREINDT